MKRQSLVYQAKVILAGQFEKGFGRSKHIDKKYNANLNVIYSRSTYKSAMQKCCTFLNYCKNNFNLHNLEDLKQNYFNQFIQDNKYSKSTANSYKWAIKKLQDGFNALYSKNCLWLDNNVNKIINANKVESVRKQMPSNIHDEIIERVIMNKLENGLAFDIARVLGLRVSEITNLRMTDFKFNKQNELKEICIYGSKGGRHRKILAGQLTKEQIAIASYIYNYFFDVRKENDRLFTNKADSYRKAFSNARNNVTNIYNQCSIHSLRKEFANNYYNREVGKNRPVKEVKKELTLLLGHNRLDVLNHYLSKTSN